MLSAMMIRLKELQDSAMITTKLGTVEQANDDEEGQFDDNSYSPDDTGAGGQKTGLDPTAVERHVLTLPSNGNVSEDVAALEIRERAKQARRQIARLRDLIADISFQYSHVVRNAPRKGFRTAAQKRVRVLHHELSFNARLYSQCRSRLITLNCGERLLRMFRVLTRQDLKASTEILKPNEQGSSSIKLSWIWQTGRYFLFQGGGGAEAGTSRDAVHPGNEAGTSGRHADTDGNNETNTDPATLLECTSKACWKFSLIVLTSFPVKRVHWLRARALNQRWHEEEILVEYEMQWTVRYFLYKCREWEAGRDKAAVAGARVYAVRQARRWRQYAEAADNLFSRTTGHYLSPLRNH